jgi:phage-related protein
MKPIEFLGDSLERIREFPSGPKREAGHQLDRVQRRIEPDDWKPMNTIGSGVKELRIRYEAGAYRVIYLAKLEQPVYVCMDSRKRPARHPQAISPWPSSVTGN